VECRSSGWPLTPSPFERQNIKLLRVLPLTQSLEISTIINLGRSMLPN
jgi:hypothetical protein